MYKSLTIALLLVLDQWQGQAQTSPGDSGQPGNKIIVLANSNYVVADTLHHNDVIPLVEFNGRLVSNNAVLDWKTKDELNSHSFDIERSTDGRIYLPVGNIIACNQAGTHEYNYNDINIVSLRMPFVYYRLKLKAADGRFSYSTVIIMPVDNEKNYIVLYPNHVNSDEASLFVTVNQPKHLQGRIIDNTGRAIKQQQWSVGAGKTTLIVNASNLVSGMYYLELRGENLNEAIRFVKQ